MSYQSRKLWDEVLGSISEKYTNEAAEFLKNEYGENHDEIYNEGETVEIRLSQRKPSKKAVIAGICSFAAAAAVFVFAFGAILKMQAGNDVLTSSGNDGQSVTDIVTSPIPSFEIPTDISLYSEDFSLFEKYFFGKWEKIYLNDKIFNGPNNVIYYNGYTYSEEHSYFSDGSDCGRLFYENDKGCFMTYDLEDDVIQTLVYIPADNTDIMYIYSVSDEPLMSDSYYYICSRVGEYEDKGTALNYFGVLKLCREMDIDPVWLCSALNYTYSNGSFVYNNVPVYDAHKYFNKFAIRIIEQDKDLLRFAVLCENENDNSHVNLYYYYCFTMNRVNGEWQSPVPDNNVGGFELPQDMPDTLDYGIIEDYFIGEWTNGEDNIHFAYTDPTDGDSPAIIAAFSDEAGWYAYTYDNEVYFIPYSFTNYMYYCDLDCPEEYTLYQLYECATAEDYDLENRQLTALGWERLCHELGNSFAEAYVDLPDSFTDENGSIWTAVIDAETGSNAYIEVYSLSGNMIELIQEFASEDMMQHFIFTFEKSGSRWSFTGWRSDIDCDITLIDYRNDDHYDNSDLTIYENIFMGKWKTDYDFLTENTITMDYSEALSLSGTPYEDTDGYYMRIIEYGSDVSYYFIPYSDTDSMYYYYYVYSTQVYSDIETRKCEYTLKYSRVSHASDSDKELNAPIVLNSCGRIKLKNILGEDFDATLSSALSSDYVDFYSHTWTPAAGYVYYATAKESDLTLLSYDENSAELTYDFVLADAVIYQCDATKEDGTLQTFKLTFTKENGIWSYMISEIEGLEQNIQYSMDMDIFSNFIGIWQDESGSEFTLNYTEDFFEADVSWIVGLGKTQIGCYMKVHRVETDADNPFIPRTDSSETVFFISCDNPRKMLVYENDSLDTEPLAEYTMVEQLDTQLPDRGYISVYGLYTLMQSYDGNLSELIQRYCFDGSITAEDGTELSASPTTTSVWTGTASMSSDDAEQADYPITTSHPEFVILEKSDTKLKLATTFYDKSGVAYDYIVTFAVYYSSSWYMDAYQPVIYGLDYAEKYYLDDGSYYAVSDRDEDDGKTHLYFYDVGDNIIYELDDNLKNANLLQDGDNLFILEENGYAMLSRYIRGYLSTTYTFAGYNDIKASIFQFSGDYLLVQVSSDSVSTTYVFSPYETALTPIMQSYYIEISENGFTILEDGEYKFYDTTGDSLEGILPLIEARLSSVWNILMLRGNQTISYSAHTPSAMINGVQMFRTDMKLFPSFDSFADFISYAFTDECTEQFLSGNTRVGEYNGFLYCSSYEESLFYEVKISDIKYTDTNQAEVSCEVYEWGNISSTSYEEPTYSITLKLVKTEQGWRIAEIPLPMSNYFHWLP